MQMIYIYAFMIYKPKKFNLKNILIAAPKNECYFHFSIQGPFQCHSLCLL